MTEHKLVKYLARSGPEPSKELQKLTPVILTDSKGAYLRSRPCHPNIKIKWHCQAGCTTTNRTEYLRDNTCQITESYGNIAIYLWTGTCDLTQKNGKYISLKSTQNESLLTQHKANIEQFIKVAKENPKIRKITILETPVYSIQRWNETKGHRDPNTFREQDTLLNTQVEGINALAREFNNKCGTSSPKFSADLLGSKKRKGEETSYRYNYKLYKDGIHPNPSLAQVWMRKIEWTVFHQCFKIKQ